MLKFVNSKPIRCPLFEDQFGKPENTGFFNFRSFRPTPRSPITALWIKTGKAHQMYLNGLFVLRHLD